jgi:5'(3')-deoxyribonucleotidase
MPKDTQWRKPLPNQVKAEVLASVFHLLISHERKAFARVPKWLRKQMSQVMFDCAVDHYDLSKDDIKLLQVYLGWLEAKHPRPKGKKAKLVLSDYAVEAGIESIEFRDGEKLVFKPKSKK